MQARQTSHRCNELDGLSCEGKSLKTVCGEGAGLPATSIARSTHTTSPQPKAGFTPGWQTTHTHTHTRGYRPLKHMAVLPSPPHRALRHRLPAQHAPHFPKRAACPAEKPLGALAPSTHNLSPLRLVCHRREAAPTPVKPHGSCWGVPTGAEPQGQRPGGFREQPPALLCLLSRAQLPRRRRSVQGGCRTPPRRFPRGFLASRQKPASPQPD